MSAGIATKPDVAAPPKSAWTIEPPYYPIVYVRGYAMTAGEREVVFNDGYYGFAATSVERREAPPPIYSEADIFEGLLIRLMKDHDYVDAVNAGLRGSRLDPQRPPDPTRSLWVSRFYDQDFFKQKTRGIQDHAEDLRRLICQTIPGRLSAEGVDLTGYKVILIAHSMGGLVCRTFLQNILPASTKEADDIVHATDPKDLVHRLVTMATPHRGIDLDAIPDFLENALTTALNPFDSGIFKEQRMREYLKLDAVDAKQEPVYDIHSLGDDAAPAAFPVKRCLCLIGSDWKSYGEVKRLTGGVSDGLVRQDNAYIVTGPKPLAGAQYDESKRAFWANVHRAHSGYRGIVNSYESYENIQRFLFGDIMVDLALDDIDIRSGRDAISTYFYDLDFAISIRGTNAYLHRRAQNPCENAMRIEVKPGAPVPTRRFLHTGFLSARLAKGGERFSNFLLRFRVTEYRVEPHLLWDHDYPGRVLFSEDLEMRVDLLKPELQFRWVSEVAADTRNEGWRPAALKDGTARLPLRAAKAFGAILVVSAGTWPDEGLTKD